MDTKFDNSIFEKASQEALNDTANERLKALGSQLIPSIIKKLQENSVDNKEIDRVVKEINSATNKNLAIINIIKRGGYIAEIIKSVANLK